MDVLTSETCWALNNAIITQVKSSWSLFIQHILCSHTLFFKSHRLWDNVEKDCAPGQATENNIIPRMRITYWISKATNTHSEYVIFIACPLQQWLHERAWSYVYTCIACLVRYVIFIHFARDLRKWRHSNSLQALERRTCSRADFDRETFPTTFARFKLPPLNPVTPRTLQIPYISALHLHMRVCVCVCVCKGLPHLYNWGM